MNTLLFFDTETTGFPEDWKAPVSEPDKWPHLVQIAWIVASTHGYYLKSESHIIKPEGFTIPAESVQFHGITTETAQIAGIDLHLALRGFLDDLHQYDPLLVAHNLEFDAKVLDAAFHRVGHGSVVAQRRGVCTMKASAETLPLGTGKWPKLEELYKSFFGEALHGAHNALYDAVATARCFFELVKEGAVRLPKDEIFLGSNAPSVVEEGFRSVPEWVEQPRPVIITNVSEPTSTRKDGTKITGQDGKPRHYFELRVSKEEGLLDISARRNFWVENNSTLNHARAKKAMETGADVSSSLDVITVETEPRSHINSDGEEVTSTTATIIVLKGEPVSVALRNTFPEALLKGERQVGEEFAQATM